MTHPLMTPALRALVLVLGITFFAACSDDTSGGSSAEVCANGEFFNELNGRCELRGRDEDPGNPGDPPGANNPSSPPDSNNNTPDAGTPPNPADAGSNVDPQDGGSPPTDSGGADDAQNNPNPAVCGPGAILGKACAPSGSVLSGATVTINGVDCDNQPFTRSVQTDGSGEYAFDDIPDGRHTLTVSIGSYSGTQDVNVYTGQTTDLTSAASKICLDAANVRIAVIEGSYDKVEGLLDDLQLSYDIKGNDQPGGSIFFPSAPPAALAFLSDLSAMEQYDIIFINCGKLWDHLQSYAPESVPTIVNNLVTYLNSGHSLYSSDWAHPFVESAFPEMIDFYGDDANTGEARFGHAPQTVAAGVVSGPLQTALGHATTEISFPHDPPSVLNDHWVVAEGVGAQSTVHIQGDVDLCGSGANCASPGATLADAPLLISHVTPGGGTVFFTSFHNESQGGISQDMEEILRFLIFQL